MGEGKVDERVTTCLTDSAFLWREGGNRCPAGVRSLGCVVGDGRVGVLAPDRLCDLWKHTGLRPQCPHLQGALGPVLFRDGVRAKEGMELPGSSALSGAKSLFIVTTALTFMSDLGVAGGLALPAERGEAPPCPLAGLPLSGSCDKGTGRHCPGAWPESRPHNGRRSVGHSTQGHTAGTKGT